MKNYMEHFATAAKNHLLWLIENPTATLLSVLIGFGIWLLGVVKIYIFSDPQYLIFLVLMIAYDAKAGYERVQYLHKLDPGKYPAPDSKTFKDKTFSKLTYYLVTLGALHGLAHFQIKNSEVTIFHALEYSSLIGIMAAEFWSVTENYAAIGRKTIFALVWSKLKDYIPSTSKEQENPK